MNQIPRRLKQWNIESRRKPVTRKCALCCKSAGGSEKKRCSKYQGKDKMRCDEKSERRSRTGIFVRKNYEHKEEQEGKRVEEKTALC